MAYWNNQFFVQYLSNPVDEHVAPGHTLLVTSPDGVSWAKPEVVFPAYVAPERVTIPDGYHGYMMHQRMGFYVSPDDRLLVLGFYGHTEHPFGAGGIGRVVREVYKDGSFGPIYFLRYSSFNAYNEANTSFPFYQKSTDVGFVAACEALLSDRLKTLQWLEEDYGKDGFYGSGRVPDSIQAFSYYHRTDGQVVGLWKWSVAALSDDEGQTFSAPVKAKSLIMAGGKQWGQRTDDDRFAIVYNPIEQQEYRFPLAMISSDDGAVFNDLLLVNSEVPARRFYGRWKDFGPCYVRGIVEGNGNPPGDDMWLTYSVNKEDIWVSRVPVKVKYAIKGAVKDDFEKLKPGGSVTDWNIYSPAWAPVSVVDKDGNRTLQLTDHDPYDYARAIRVFEESEKVNMSFEVTPDQNDQGTLQIEVTDQFGSRPVRIHFDSNGDLVAFDGHSPKVIAHYEPRKTYMFELKIAANPDGSYDLKLNGKTVLEHAELTEAVKSVERISFRTCSYRNTPNRKTPNQKPYEPLAGADEPVKEAVYRIDELKVR